MAWRPSSHSCAARRRQILRARRWQSTRAGQRYRPFESFESFESFRSHDPEAVVFGDGCRLVPKLAQDFIGVLAEGGNLTHDRFRAAQIDRWNERAQRTGRRIDVSPPVARRK